MDLSSWIMSLFLQIVTSVSAWFLLVVGSAGLENWFLSCFFVWAGVRYLLVPFFGRNEAHNKVGDN